MIRVELLHGHGRQWPPWAGPAAFALVVCGGLYGLNWLFPFGQLIGGSADEPAGRGRAQEAQVAAADPWAADEQEAPAAADPWAADAQETPAADPWAADEGEQTAAAWPADAQQAAPAATTPAAPPVQQAVQPPPVQPQIVAPAPVPAPTPVATYAPPAPDGARQVPRRSAACQWAVRINERVPRGVRLVSLTCSAAGDYGLEGTSASEQSLRSFRDQLQKLPSEVSLSSWQEGRAPAKVLRFAFQGRFEEAPARELATLSSDQADRLFGKVAHWADESGLDGLSIKKPIAMPLPPARTHQRQKLWGTGSYQQIGAFLHKLQQVEEIAALGEVVLMPVQGGEHGWVEARLYAAVDVVVGMP